MGLMKNFMDSKVLALSCIILFISSIVSVLCALLPFWFRLRFGVEDATYGSEGQREEELQMGLFYLFKPNKPGPERTRVLMTSLLSMDKSSNLPVVPPMFVIGQIFYTIGVFGIVVGMAGAFILAVKELASMIGMTGLAIFSLMSAIAQVLGVAFAVFTALDSASTWHLMPLEKSRFRFVITSHPTMSMDWGFYIAVIGAALSVFGAVLLVIEALKVCKSIDAIRARQMREKPQQDPYPDIRYARFSYADVPRPKPDYQPQYQPQHFHGHSTPGMVLSRGPPQQQFIAQPQPSPQPYPKYGEYHPPPPPPDYKADPGGLREVDL